MSAAVLIKKYIAAPVRDGQKHKNPLRREGNPSSQWWLLQSFQESGPSLSRAAFHARCHLIVPFAMVPLWWHGGEALAVGSSYSVSGLERILPPPSLAIWVSLSKLLHGLSFCLSGKGNSRHGHLPGLLRVIRSRVWSSRTWLGTQHTPWLQVLFTFCR